MYLVNSRPYLCFVVNTLSQFMVELQNMCWDTLQEQWSMVWTTGGRMGSGWLASQIQIGQVVWQTGRALLDVVSVWARQQCRSSVGSKSLLLWVMRMLSIWQPVRPVERHCGLTSCWWIYLIRIWGLQWSTMTIKFASSSLRIQYFMTGQSILRLGIISFEIMFIDE